MPDNTDLIKPELEQALALERQLNEQVKALKAAEEQIKQSWEAVLSAMVAHDVKKIKGDFGTITVAERTSYKVDESKLAQDFKILKPDTKKIGSYYSLTGEAPEGVTPQTTQYLVRRLK